VRGSAVLETYSVISSSAILVATDFVLPFPDLVPLLILPISVAQDVASLARSSFACNDYLIAAGVGNTKSYP